MDLITVNLDDDVDAIDAAPAQTVSGTKRAIIVKMKESIGDYLGLVPVAYDDAIFTGTFAGEQTGATNKGAKFRKNLGGFRFQSFKFIAKTKFTIGEIVLDTDGYKTENSDFASFSIGFPRGISVTELITWYATTGKIPSTRAIITPYGKRIPLSSAT